MVQGCLAAALAAAPIAIAPAHAKSDAQRTEAAVKSAAKSDRELKAFYKARSYRPLWIRGSTLGPEADRLVALVTSANIDGIDPERYKPRKLIEAVSDARGGSPKALARAETLLSRTLAAYVRDTRAPRDVGMVFVDRELAPGVPPPRYALTEATRAPSLYNYLEELEWMNPLYAQLREALESGRYDGNRSAIPIPAGPLMKPGASGSRVALLRHRLGLAEGTAYDPVVAAAVKEFQAARGLPADAVAGPRTIAALNEPAPDREALLRLNLERARALPPARGGRYILVDAASAQLSMYENGRVVDSMKVIVGKPTEQTPMLAAYIRYASLNPYWHMPPDLVRLRIVPNVLKKGPGWLRSAGYEVVSAWTDDARVVEPASVDWAAVAAGRLDVPVRQLPGKGNAMGRMKFMLPNEMGIYLHDTPEKELFASADRRFSSGCVRVEDAPRLARWLFGRVPKARSAAPEQRVNLPEPVPVYITYLTAAPTAKGIAFRSDPYRRDVVQLARWGGRLSGASR